jgi:hypothetical protein
MWLYNGKEISDDEIEGYASFVYIITNLENNKRYIGKKIFKSIQRKKVKGKTRKKKVEKESDWKSYYGSNLVLLGDVEKLGSDRFRREIVKLCKTRGTASYWEAKLQMQHEVLENPDLFYNEWIMVKVHRSHLKLDF